MAIKIPSSHIFEREYSASKENRINQLDIAYIKANPKTEVGYTVERSTTDILVDEIITEKELSSSSMGNDEYGATFDVVPYYYILSPSYKIQKLNDFGYISSLYSDSDNPNVKCTVTYDKITYERVGTQWSEVSRESFTEYPQPTELAIANIQLDEFSGYADLSNKVLSAQRTHAEYSPDKDKDYENFTNVGTNIKFFVGGERELYVWKYGAETYLIRERVEYKPTQIQWEIFGDVIVADYENKELTITEENITPTDDGVYRIEGSEILQRIGRRYDSVIKAYANGKKTATLTVAFGDYYDHSTGDLKISVGNNALPMGFSIYDRVIPYVFSAKGDKPLSTDKDGTPTEFVVLQVEPFYDGSTLQKIYLQEA